MGAYFEEKAVRQAVKKAALVELREGVVARSRAAYLEGRRATAEYLTGWFVGIFGENPKSKEAQVFFDALLDDWEKVTQGLCEIYGCGFDDLRDD